MSEESIVRLVFLGDTAQAVRSVDKLEGSFAGLGRTAKLAAGALGVGLVGALGESVKHAVDFQQQMKLVQTQAGGTAKDVRVLSKEVLQLAKSTSQGPEELAKAMFHLKSLGLDNAKAMGVLKQASRGAMTGIADLEETTNALGGAVRVGIRGTENYSSAMGTLNAIVGAGNMRMGELVGALGTGLLPTAKLAGLSLRDVGAALAVFTDENVPAEQAATRMRTSLMMMQAPSKKAEGAMEALGFTSQKIGTMIRGPQGFVGAIRMISDQYAATIKRLGGGKAAQTEAFAAMSAAFGGSKTAATVMTLVNNVGMLGQKYEQIGRTAGNFNKDVAASTQTAANQMKIAWSSVEVAMVQVGTALLPTVVQIAHGVGQIGDAFSKHMPAIQNHLLQTVRFVEAFGHAVANVAGPVLHLAGELGVFNTAVAALAGVMAYRLATAVADLGLRFQKLVTQAFAAQAAMEATAAASAATQVAQSAVAWEQVGGAMVATTTNAERLAGGAAAAAGSVSKIGVAGRLAMGMVGGPVGLATLAVAGLAAGLAYAWMKSRELSGGLKELHDALVNTTTAVDDLAHANLGLVAAKANVHSASLQVTTSEHALADAISNSGRNSDAAKQAADQLAQSRVQLKEATQAERDAEKSATTAREKALRIAQQLTEGYYKTASAAAQHVKRLESENELLNMLPGAASSAHGAMGGLADGTDLARMKADVFISRMVTLEGHLQKGDTYARHFADAAVLLAQQLGRIPSQKEITIYMREVNLDQHRSTLAGATSRAVGGFIPGANGAAVPILAHAGEAILNQSQVQRLGGPVALARMFGWSGDQGPSFATGGIVGGIDPFGGNVQSDANRKPPPPPRHKHPRATKRKRLGRVVAQGEAETAGIANEITELDLSKSILDEQYNHLAEEFDLANRNLDYILTDPSSGVESLNTNAVGTRTAQIHVLEGSRSDVQRILDMEMTRVKEMLNLLGSLIPQLQAQIADLKQRIAQETKRINDDVKKIRQLQDAIAKDHGELARERAKKGTRQYVTDPLTGRKVIRTVGGPDENKIHALEGDIRKLENEKRATERDKQDTTHKRTADQSQVSKLTSKLTSFQSEQQTQNVAAQLTLPTAVDEVQLEIDRLNAELADLGNLPGQIATYNKQLLAGQDVGSGGDMGGGPLDLGFGSSSGVDNSDLVRQVGALKLALAIQNAQLPIIGAYQRGALHVSESGLAMIHAGEEIRQSNKSGGLDESSSSSGGGGPVSVHIAEGMGFLRGLIHVEIDGKRAEHQVVEGRDADRRRRGGRF